MTHEAVMLINDLHRMSESLTKLIEHTEVPHDHMELLEGLEDIREGVHKVVDSIVKAK